MSDGEDFLVNVRWRVLLLLPSIIWSLPALLRKTLGYLAERVTCNLLSGYPRMYVEISLGSVTDRALTYMRQKQSSDTLPFLKTPTY
jgi:hypothetical protein